MSNFKIYEGEFVQVDGGTGKSSFTNGQLLIGKTANTLSKGNLTSSGSITITNGSGTINLEVANPVSSPVTVEQGGTGQISYSDGELLIGNSNPIIKLSKSTLTGTINQINVTNSAGSITLSTPQDIETTSTPEFVGVNLETSGGIQTTLNYYEEYTHTTDWNCLAWSTSPQSGNVQITRVGKKITLSCPLLIFTTGGGTSNGEIQMSIVLPERFRPSSTTYQIVHIINVALYGSGVAQVSLTGTINVYSNVSLGTFTNVAGNGGFSGFSITYTL